MSTEKSEMGCVESVASSSETEASSIFSRNLVVTEFIELCIQPNTNKEKEGILLEFWKKFKNLPRDGDFSEIDAVCMFVLDYAYKKRCVSVSTMSRSLFAYQRQVQVKFFGNPAINPSIDCFLKELRGFTNLYTYSKCNEMLVDVGLGSVLDGGIGLTLFLIKFAIMEFPAEDNASGRKMVEMLVLGFNGFVNGAAGVWTSVNPDELLRRIRQSSISFRRALLIFCTIVIVAEYEVQEKMEARYKLPSVIKMKGTMTLKLKCLDVINTATSETKIILRDIEKFIAEILSLIVHGSVCRLIMQTARRLFSDLNKFHNPRSLKDLARHKLRASFRRGTVFPEYVDQLPILDTLRDHLLFQREEIWDLLKENHQFHTLNMQLMKYL